MPLIPLTCSVHFFASSLCWISLYAASACFIAALAVAVAVEIHPPHQPPPACSAASCCCCCSAGTALFSDSCSSELVALGVRLGFKLRALSVDFLAAVSAATAAAAGRLVSLLRRGVCGREETCWEASWDSRSARRSSSPSLALGLEDLPAVAAFFGLESLVMSEKSSSTSRLSSAALVFLEAMVACGSDAAELGRWEDGRDAIGLIRMVVVRLLASCNGWQAV